MRLKRQLRWARWKIDWDQWYWRTLLVIIYFAPLHHLSRRGRIAIKSPFTLSVLYKTKWWCSVQEEEQGRRSCCTVLTGRWWWFNSFHFSDNPEEKPMPRWMDGVKWICPFWIMINWIVSNVNTVCRGFRHNQPGENRVNVQINVNMNELRRYT